MYAFESTFSDRRDTGSGLEQPFRAANHRNNSIEAAEGRLSCDILHGNDGAHAPPSVRNMQVNLPSMQL